jgi:hypothetical protein
MNILCDFSTPYINKLFHLKNLAMQLKTRLFKLFAFIVFVAFLAIVVAYRSRLATDSEGSMAAFYGNDTTKNPKDTLSDIVVIGYGTKHGRVIEPARKKADSASRQKNAASNAAADTSKLPISGDTTRHH